MGITNSVERGMTMDEMLTLIMDLPDSAIEAIVEELLS